VDFAGGRTRNAVEHKPLDGAYPTLCRFMNRSVHDALFLGSNDETQGLAFHLVEFDHRCLDFAFAVTHPNLARNITIVNARPAKNVA